MKRLYVLGSVFVAAAVLAACGGGGGSTPGPLPSTTPKTVYTAQLRFVGPLAGVTIQDDLRRAQSAEPMTATTPIPIMVVEPPVSGKDTSVYGGEVQAVVSPEPTSVPSVTFSQTNANAIIFTPPPSNGTPQPLPSGVVAQTSIKGANVVQAQSAGVAQAVIGDPVDQQPTTVVYSYMGIEMSCVIGSFSPGGLQPAYQHYIGWQWNGSAWVGDNDTSTADVYMDGPNCQDSQNPSESDYTVHIPGGDVRISTDTPFSSITASQWSNAETSYQPNANGLINPDGSIQCMVIGKTRGGTIFKWDAANAGCQFGAIEVSGAGVDGF